MQTHPPDTIAIVLRPGQRLAVFSVRNTRRSSVWVRAGHAEVHGDGSLTVVLDVLPLDGRLHLRAVADGGSL